MDAARGHQDDQHNPMSTFGEDDYLRSANLAETVPPLGDDQ